MRGWEGVHAMLKQARKNEDRWKDGKMERWIDG